MKTALPLSDKLRYTVVIEPLHDPAWTGWYYAHVPTLDLTTHGEGVEGALAAAQDLVTGWVAELRAAGRDVPHEEAAFVTHVAVDGG